MGKKVEEKIEEKYEKVEEKVIVKDGGTYGEIPAINAQEVITVRLAPMLQLKGSDITQNKLIRVGGRGKCGANCISLLTTGGEEMAEEIAENKNQHIVNNWEIYKESFEFPHTERVGNFSRTFMTEDYFLIFLLTEEEASTMWMTHTCMQAVSTMLNVNISILTTGITPPVSHICSRCTMQTVFSTEEELRRHTETVHHRIESEEERQGRIQRARWTILKPDTRIRKDIPNERPEEMILLHEDDIHYNIILHKSHNTFKSKTDMAKHMVGEQKEEITIFGDKIQSQNHISWAEITKINRPANLFSPETGPQSSSILKPGILAKGKKMGTPPPDIDSWQEVNRKRNVDNRYNIPVRNRFEGLCETNDNIVKEKEQTCFRCDVCKFEFSTKSMLKTHMKIHKNIEE